MKVRDFTCKRKIIDSKFYVPYSSFWKRLFIHNFVTFTDNTVFMKKPLPYILACLLVVHFSHATPLVSARSIPLTSCGAPNGEVMANVGGETEGYTFTWYCGHQAIGTPCFQGSHITGLTIGYYTVVATDNVTGESSNPASLMIADERLLPNPTITASGDVLSAHSAVGSTYKWYADGELLPHTTADITITMSGSYQVEISTDLGCADISPAVVAIITDVENSPADFSVYPNPAVDYLNVSSGKFTQVASVNFISANGHIIPIRKIDQADGNCVVDISDLEVGSYLIVVRASNRDFVKRLIKIPPLER